MPEKRSVIKNDLSIVIVNHNDRNRLKTCLSALQTGDLGRKLEIIVVDNASTDGSPKMIHHEFPEIRLIENSDNQGFGKANNQGIRTSRGKYILLINADAVISLESLRVLVRELESHQDWGAAAPALIGEDGRCQVSFGDSRTFSAELANKIWMNRRYRRQIEETQDNRQYRWLSAACLLIRKEALDDIGLFDEGFFLYFEDIDLCFRLNDRGWKTVLIPKVTAFHKGGSSTEKLKEEARSQYRRSQLYFYKKHNPGPSRFLLSLYHRVCSLMNKLRQPQPK